METYIGTILMVGFNFAPMGWAMCDGQLLPINEYQALFSLLGTTYGGDGIRTFALPNLQGCLPMGMSSTHPLGQTGNVSGTASTPPQHTLALNFIIALVGIFPPRN
jgi:microcystin-dependent protein